MPGEGYSGRLSRGQTDSGRTRHAIRRNPDDVKTQTQKWKTRQRRAFGKLNIGVRTSDITGLPSRCKSFLAARLCCLNSAASPPLHPGELHSCPHPLQINRISPVRQCHRAIRAHGRSSRRSDALPLACCMAIRPTQFFRGRSDSGVSRCPAASCVNNCSKEVL